MRANEQGVLSDSCPSAKAHHLRLSTLSSCNPDEHETSNVD